MQASDNALSLEKGSSAISFGIISNTGGRSCSPGTSMEESTRKLLAVVKRSAPHMVPACNRLIQRLHDQDCAILEYSSREVDLINLLVELASDRQTNSLKEMMNRKSKQKDAFNVDMRYQL